MLNRSCIALLALLAASPVARAADCNGLKILASVPMLPFAQSALRLVPVDVDGTRKTFLLDTGGSLSQVTQRTADELDLATQAAPIHLYNMYGEVSGREALVHRFAVGNLRTSDYRFAISPERDTAGHRLNIFDTRLRGFRTRIDGVLAPDLMAKYDIELDFDNNTLNYLSQDHCEGKVVYWDASALAVVPMQFANLQLTIPVTLDGHALTAVIDTGSPRSMMSLDTAAALGLAPDSGLHRSGHLGGNASGPPLYTATFRMLTFAGVQVENPAFGVIDDLIRGRSEAANGPNLAVLPQVLLGMDILRKVHLYIAFRERKIYITQTMR